MPKTKRILDVVGVDAAAAAAAGVVESVDVTVLGANHVLLLVVGRGVQYLNEGRFIPEEDAPEKKRARSCV